MENERPPWKRQPQESQRAYAAFCVYRDMGADRSLTGAVKQWLTVSPTKPAPKRQRQQRRYRAHDNPAVYVRTTRRQWATWSKKWHWVDRCKAFDDFATAEAEDRALDAQIQRKLEEQREREEEAKRTRTGARTLKLVGQQLAFEVAAALQAGEHKKILTCEKCGFVMGQDRLQALLPHLAKAATAFDVGAKHERLEESKPTEIIQTNLSEATMQRIAQIIMARTPEEQWETVAEEVATALKETGVG